MSVRKTEKSKYCIPMSGHPLLHRELTWYATDHDEVLGVVILDLVDHDFSWVALVEKEDGYRAVQCKASLPSIEEATRELHRTMAELLA